MNLTDLKPALIDPITLKQKAYTFVIDHIEPYSIYTTLKAQFGMPNAALSKNSQWSYELEAPTAFMRINDWKLYGCTLIIYPDDQLAATAQAIYESLKSIFNKARNTQDSAIKKTSESSNLMLLQNPYRLYMDTGVELLELAKDQPSSHQGNTLCRSAFFQFLSAFEGLLNIIYDLYLKPAIRQSKDTRDTAIKAPIDTKIAMAPIYCICFSSERLQINSTIYDQYKAVRALRNNFVHANLVDAMRTRIVKLDTMTFLLEPTKTKDYDLPLVVSNLSIAHLDFTKQAIESMSAEIVKAMHPTYRQDFAKALERDAIIVERIDNGSYVIRSEI
ncbi:hypothetical protein SE18_01580 [Herpetosiphon geysericola]|uniref:Uncharacterized protein n=1 Tax=Herpetosiphon geysericola TaxID=70996 RepID=A0A0P6YN54_9CHLR|nr:hypothetical protein SE18_01580 [Herpetosiphon geysericola]